jgi:hypothetical protein
MINFSGKSCRHVLNSSQCVKTYYVSLQSTVIENVLCYGLVEICEHFRRTCCLWLAKRECFTVSALKIERSSRFPQNVGSDCMTYVHGHQCENLNFLIAFNCFADSKSSIPLLHLLHVRQLLKMT